MYWRLPLLLLLLFYSKGKIILQKKNIMNYLWWSKGMLHHVSLDFQYDVILWHFSIVFFVFCFSFLCSVHFGRSTVWHLVYAVKVFFFHYKNCVCKSSDESQISRSMFELEFCCALCVDFIDFISKRNRNEKHT